MVGKRGNLKLFGYNSVLREGPSNHDEELLRFVRFVSLDWNCVPSLVGPDDPIIVHFAGFTNDNREIRMPRLALKSCLRAFGSVKSYGSLRAWIAFCARAVSRIIADGTLVDLVRRGR